MSEEEKLQLENECLLKYSKAQMIQKYIDELEENCTLSDLWCKSQEKIKEVRKYINYYENIRGYYEYEENGYDEYNYDEDLKQELLEILDKENI